MSELPDGATGKAVDDAQAASGEKPQKVTASGRRKAANSPGRKRRKVKSKIPTKKKRGDTAGKPNSATKKKKT